MAYYHQDSLSIATRKILAQLIAEVTSINIIIEYFRTSISDIPSTDSLGLFRYLDKEQKGFIVLKDIQRIMGTKHTKLLTYAFSWIDIRKVGEVSRFEFASFLMPRENLLLREKNMKNLQQRHGAIQISPQLNIQVGLFQKMIVQIMNKQMKAIEIRHSLISSSDYTLKGAYSALTNSDRSWICSDDILKFMTNYGYHIQLNDSISTIEAFSSQQSGQLSISDFKWIVQGFEKKQKSYLGKIKTCNSKKPAKKPIIQEKSLQKYIEQKKGNACQKEKEFNRLMGKIKQIERHQKTKQKKLQKNQRTSLQKARREMQIQISGLKLKRQKEAIKRLQQRQQKAIQFQLKTDLQTMLLKTRYLQEQGEKLQRLNNRMRIHQDTLLTIDNTGPLSYFQGRKNSLSQKDNRSHIGQFASLNEDLQNESCRKAIQKHIDASCLYLQQGRQMHSFILSERDRVRKHILANKQNLSQNSKKTPGVIVMSKNESHPIANKIDEQKDVQRPSSSAKSGNIFSPLTL